MTSKAARIGLLLGGVALAATFASTAVAFKFHWETGYPWLGGWFYWPLDVWRWWQAWGQFNTRYGSSTHRTVFLQGLTMTVPLLIAPGGLWLMFEMYGPLKPGTDPSRRAGMGNVPKLRKSGHVVRRGDGVVLGCDPDRWPWRQRTLRDNGDGHVLIMGSSRIGKGIVHVVRTLLSHRGSMLVFDPKHELSQISGRWRRTLGPVHVVDPTDPLSAKFNPLLELRQGAHLIGDCLMLADMMTSDAPGESKDGDKFWRRRATALLAAMLYHVALSDEPTLGHVWRLSDDIANDRLPKSADPWVAAAFNTHRGRAQNTRDGIEEQLASHLSFLADPIIRHMTSSSDFRAGDLQAAERPVTVFLAPPVSDGQRLRPLLRLMLEGIVSALTTDQKHTADGRLKQRNVLALIDEFPQLGRMSAVEFKMPVAAGYGVRFCLVCQDEDQIGSLYGSKQSITANCSTIAYYAGFSGSSLQTVARWGGTHAIAHSSKQLSASLRGSSSRSQSEAERPLLDPGEMLKRSKKEVLIFTHGVPPTYLLKGRGYWREGEFKGRWDVQGSGTVPTPCSGGVAYAEPEQEQNKPVDKLSDDDAAMLASVEELLAEMPPALRQRINA